MSFDAYELCSPELQERLRPVRDKFEAEEEAKAEAQMPGKQAGTKAKLKPQVVKKDETPKEYENFDFPNGNVYIF